MNSGVRFGPAFVWGNPVGENKSHLKPKEKYLAMNGTKKLLIGLVTVAAMPAFADTKTTNTSSSETRLETLFKADLQYRSESQLDAVVVAEGREGVYIGSGDGTVTGDHLSGTVRWSLWSGNCLYPLVRSGQPVPEGLHLCTINPALICLNTFSCQPSTGAAFVSNALFAPS